MHSYCFRQRYPKIALTELTYSRHIPRPGVRASLSVPSFSLGKTRQLPYSNQGREGGGGEEEGGPNSISQEIVFFKSQPVLLKLKSHSHFSIVFFS